MAWNRMHDGETLEQRLFRKQEETEIRKQAMRDMKRDNDLIGCTFHPHIHNSPSEYPVQW